MEKKKRKVEKKPKVIDRIKSFLNNDNVLLTLLTVFMIIQPFLDFAPFFVVKKLELFGFTIPTIIRCLYIGFMLLFLVKKFKYLKNKWLYITYLGFVIVYFLIHNYVCKSNINIPSSYKYSTFSEMFYVIRMSFLFIIAYITYHSKLEFDRFLKTIFIVSFIIGLGIFITNTFKISFKSYSDNLDLIKYNWLDWNKALIKKVGFAEFASRGWFYMANQVSALSMMILCIDLYGLLKRPGKFAYISTFSLIIGMIMLSTRTASFGWIVCVVFILVLFFLYKLIFNKTNMKYKNSLYIFMLLPVSILLFLNSPSLNRVYNYKVSDYEDISTEDKKEPDKVEAYLLKNYSKLGIQKVYIFKIYPYTYDKIFWLDTFEYVKKNGVLDNRAMEINISKRIAENNNNELKYKLFGYSFSRMRNGKNYIEHDFLAQYYTIGIVGILLLIFPYLFVIGLIIFKMLHNLKNLTMLNTVLCSSIFVAVGVSIFSGHVLDELFVTLFIGFIFGFVLKNCKEKGVL